MLYLLLLYGNEAGDSGMTEEQMGQEMDAYYAYDDLVTKQGVFKIGEALDYTKSAKTIRIRDGQQMVTDGPFAETKEQLGGFYLLDCKDLDEAIELAAKVPAAQRGSVEIRTVVVYG